MIQQQTFAIDGETRRRLLELGMAIKRHKDDREFVCKLIAEQDRLMKAAPIKDYDPCEEAKWV